MVSTPARRLQADCSSESNDVSCRIVEGGVLFYSQEMCSLQRVQNSPSLDCGRGPRVTTSKDHASFDIDLVTLKASVEQIPHDASLTQAVQRDEARNPKSKPLRGISYLQRPDAAATEVQLQLRLCHTSTAGSADIRLQTHPGPRSPPLSPPSSSERSSSRAPSHSRRPALGSRGR